MVTIVIFYYLECVFKKEESMISREKETKQKPLVSVLMGTYNTEEVILDAAIKSILNQSYNNLELIIVDDNTDIYDISEYILRYNDPRIKLLRNKQNMGLAASLNRAIDVAVGTYLARMDSDDISVETRLANQVLFMECNPDIKLSYSRAIVFGKSKYLRCDLWNNAEYRKASFLFKSGITHPAVMFDSKFIKEKNIRYDSGYKKSQDYELWTRIQEYGDVIKEIPHVGLYYRTSVTQASATGNNQEQRKYADTVRLREIKKLGLEPSDVELLCHRSLSVGEISSGIKIEEIESWCLKIIDANRRTARYKMSCLKIAISNQFLALPGARMSSAIRIFGLAVFFLVILKMKRKVIELFSMARVPDNIIKD